MTRATMRALLRRQVQEETADQWTDADLNEALNHGLLMCEKEILKIDAQAFAYLYQRDLAASTDIYPLPTAFMHEHRIEILNATTNEYARIARIDEADRESYRASGSTTYRYTILGRYIFLTPTPTAALVNGLRLLYAPVLTMADDADTPEVDDSLHTTIVAVAKILLLEDTSESADSARRRVAESVADLPLFRVPGAPEYVTVSGIVTY